MSELLRQSEEGVERLGGDRLGWVSDASFRKEPGDCRGQKLGIVFEKVSIADQNLKKKRCSQMAVVLQEVTTE